MAMQQVRLADSMVRNAIDSDSLRFRMPSAIPEDGVDSDDEDSEETHTSTNWVVRNSFLELASDEKDSLRFKLYKTDSWLMADRSMTIGSSDRECDDSTMCSTPSSTREPSADDVKVTRQRSVRFAVADEVEEVQQMKRVPSVISIASLKSDYSPMRRASSRFGLQSDQVCRISSKLSIGGHDDAEQSFGRFCSIRTDMSPRSRTQTAEDLGFMVARGSYSPRNCAHTEYRQTQGAAPSAELIGPQQTMPFSPTISVSSQQSLSANPTVQFVPAPIMMLNPCNMQVRTQMSAPSAPPGSFSVPPGSFLEPAKVAGKEQEELLDQQRMLQEQKRRLLSMSSTYTGTPAWTMPAPQKSFGSWNQWKGQSHQYVRQRSQAEAKPHDRTTVVIRDLPTGFSRDMVADFLNSQGFEKKFDFIYTPVKFSVMTTIGYAFVNFVSAEAALECISKLDGFNGWATPSENSLSVLWSEKDQGLATIIDRHRNSPVMHPSVREEFKPVLYVDGVKTAFPLPTKHVKPPRVQRYNRDNANADGDEEEL